MSKKTGKCPGCDADGSTGQPCSERGCKKSGLHFIAEDHWKKAHPKNGEGPDRVIGQIVGDFLVVGLLGAGGFGKVYLALQTPRLRLKGALKLLEFSTDDPELTKAMLEKFDGEAQALAQLSHPNIVRLLKSGKHGDRPYLVMEYVEGQRTLRDELYVRTQNMRGFAPDEIIHILGQIVNGLAAAHEQNIIHRDIKPENIMLQSVVGNSHYVRLLDFGLAKFVEQRADTRWHLGSPNYMAPEQISRKNLGPWTDLYAVAVIAFEMISGRRPFPGATDNEVLVKKIQKEYDPLVQLAELDYPKPALDFLGRGLARNPKKRHKDIHQFHEEMVKAVQSVADRLGPSGAVLDAGTKPLSSDDLVDVFQPIYDRAHTRATVKSPAVQEAEDAQNRTTRNASEKAPVGDAEANISDRPTRKKVKQKPPKPDITIPSPDEFAFLEESGSQEFPLEDSDLEEFEEKPRTSRRLLLLALMSIAATVGIIGFVGLPFGLDEHIDFDLNFAKFAEGADNDISAAVSDEVLVFDLDEIADAGVEDGPADAGAATVAADAADAEDGEDGDADAPAEEEGEDRLILEMALGKFHTCLLLRGGDVRCWGANFDAELGLGHRRSIGDRAPAHTAPFVRLGEPAIHIAAAGDREASFTCALLKSKNVRCWGSNHFGQLGYGHTNRIGLNEHPEEVGYVELGGPVRQLTAGAMQYATHACAILESGDVRCWGNNRYGQLGYGHTNHIGDSQVPASFDPVDVGGKVKEISAGKFHTCALLEDGGVRCWGRNNTGQLGYGHTNDIGDTESPASVDLVDVGGKVKQISLGRGHTCAVLESGNARCWGWNRNGQLGYGNTDNVGDKDSPASAGDLELGAPVLHISAGGLHTCALLEGGRVRCWGDNRFGQLGYGHRRNIGDSGPISAAGDVNLGGRAVALKAANYHTCAVLEDDTLRCWGFNQFAQLGYGHAEHVGHRDSPASEGPVPFLAN